MTDIFDLALACYRRPLDYQDWLSLAIPLPEGMDRLMWLANGSPEAIEAGIRQTGAKPQELQDAARFCIQQWCLVRGADPHRVLGVEPGAPPEQIKEHYRLLIRLFHPDRTASRETWTDHYASRINEAWAALSRTPDRALPDNQSPILRHAQAQDTVLLRAERAVERPGSLSSCDRPGPWRRARRRWLPQLVWGGLTLAVMMVLGGFYLDRFSVSRSGLEPTSAVDSAFPSRLTMAPEPVAAPATDAGAFGPLLAAPDWRALEQREQQAQRQIAQAREARKQWEDSRQQQVAAEEALLEKVRAERARLEEQVKIEQARMEEARAERLAVEQQRLARLQAEQTHVEQVRTERELAEQRRLEALQAEQARAEHLAEELQIERQRLERLKAEQVRAEQVRAEQANVEQVQAERQRLEEQLKSRRARAEQVRAERARLEAVAPVAVAAAPEKNDLTAGELESLMSRYTRAYQRADLGSVMALFATGARGRIENDYATLFATHHIRGLRLRDLRWRYHGPSASGSGYYELQLRQRHNGELRQVEGSIRFTVQKRDNQVLIEAIEYDWPES